MNKRDEFIHNLTKISIEQTLKDFSQSEYDLFSLQKNQHRFSNAPKWWWKIQKRKCYDYTYMYHGAGDSNNKKVRKLNLFSRNIYWCLLLEALLSRAYGLVVGILYGCIRQTWLLNCNEESSINRPRFPRIEWFSECLTAGTFCASGWIDLFWHFFCSYAGWYLGRAFLFCDSDKAMELPQYETIYGIFFFVGNPYMAYRDE